MINERKYPTLAWSSFRPGLLPEHLQIATVDHKSLFFMKNSKAFNNFIGLLGFDYYQGNSWKDRIRKEAALSQHEPHLNVYLSNKAFEKVEHDQSFRMKVWNSNIIIPSRSGSILFKDGGCYLYRILSPEDSQVYKFAGMTDIDIEKGSRYFAIAFFIEDCFLSFEEGFILPNGAISVGAGGHYAPNNDIGQYISFSLITLKGFWGNVFKSRTLVPKTGLNESSQKINYLE